MRSERVSWIGKLLALAVVGVFVAACSDDDGEDGSDAPATVVGEWELTSVRLPDVDVEMDPADSGWVFELTLRADQTFHILQGVDWAEPQPMEGTWQTAGGILTLVSGEQTSTYPYTLADDLLTLELAEYGGTPMRVLLEMSPMD